MKDSLTMGEVVKRSANQYPNRTAVIFEDKRLTYKQYNKCVNKAANVLLSFGLKKGAHVAILGMNSIEYLELCHATAKTGIIFGTINWRLAPDEIFYIVQDAGNKILFVEAEFQNLVSKFQDKLKDVKIIVYGGKITLQNALSYNDLVDSANDEEPEVEVNGEDEAIIMYTSGTTGLPKGAVLTHTNVVWDMISALTYITPQQYDCYLCSMPMNHVSGLHGATTTFLMRGLPIVIMKQWKPEEACQLIEKYRITIAYILITPLQQLLESPLRVKYDLTSLRRVMSAAAKYTPELVTSALSELELDSLQFVYGLTEAAPIVSFTEYSAQMTVKPNTLGFPVWYTEVKIVDENDKRLQTGEVGEIIVRGPNVFKGYHNLPEANKDVLKNGWLHTGDLGYLDKDNFLFFVDRKKDMIKSGGENVFSIEVELALLNTSPEITEVAVVGIPDEKWGEAVTAFVVGKSNETIDVEGIKERARTVLGGYKLPKKIVVLDELPKNVSGKVLKRKLRDKFIEEKSNAA